jgi:hypothetical protein
MQSVISWLSGDRHGLPDLGVNEVPMAPLPAPVYEPCLRKICDQVPHLSGQALPSIRLTTWARPFLAVACSADLDGSPKTAAGKAEGRPLKAESSALKISSILGYRFRRSAAGAKRRSAATAC